jgi:hypothetical protein
MTPHLVKWHSQYNSQGLTVIEVENGAIDKLAVVEDHVKSAGLPFVVLHDTAGATCQTYGIRAFPTAYLIGRDGKVAWEGHPGGDISALEREIEKALRESN